ncbi:hypothetical protein ACE6H2_016243 [Prunus campanulata]
MILVIFAFHVIQVAIWCVKMVKGCRLYHKNINVHANEGGNEGTNEGGSEENQALDV